MCLTRSWHMIRRRGGPSGAGQVRAHPRRKRQTGGNHPPAEKEIILPSKCWSAVPLLFSAGTSIIVRHNDKTRHGPTYNRRKTGGEPLYLHHFCKLESLCAPALRTGQHALSIK